MHLTHHSFDSQMIKGEVLQYVNVLLLLSKITTLVEQSFHRALLEDEYPKHHTFQPGDFITGKDTSRKTLFHFTGNDPIRYY